MNVAVRRTGDVAVLELSGKILGGAESNVLRDELDRALARGDTRLLIDLQDVPWMNSAGLGGSPALTTKRPTAISRRENVP